MFEQYFVTSQYSKNNKLHYSIFDKFAIIIFKFLLNNFIKQCSGDLENKKKMFHQAIKYINFRIPKLVILNHKI